MILFVSSAYAWSLIGVTWSWQDHPIEDTFGIAASSFPADVGNDAQVVEDIEGAMAQWHGIGRDLQVLSGGEVANSVRDPEGMFVIGYGSDGGSLGGTLAYATTWAYEDGAAFDCDIRFLARNDYGALSWDATGSAGGRYQIGIVALHELGHCLGLDHSADPRAVMYAYYNAVPTLTGDDIAGVRALYDASPCVDADGDGWTDCASDCDDHNALVNPGAGESCDGADDDCDGVIDATAQRTVSFGATGGVTTYDWPGFANVVHADMATRLVRVRQRISADEGTRLVWGVYEAGAAEGPYTLVRTEISYATDSGWEDSPAMDLPLTAGRFYSVGVGALGDGVLVRIKAEPELNAQGPLSPLGIVGGRALLDQMSEVQTGWLVEQQLVVIDIADPDEDGVTAECGDPCPLDMADDSDGDGSCDSDDPCPEDVDDDLDGDGVCAPEDPCPLDAADDTDGDGLCDSDDPCPDGDCDDSGTPDGPGNGGDGGDSDAGCGCGSAEATPHALGLIAGLLLARRRRGA